MASYRLQQGLNAGQENETRLSLTLQSVSRGSYARLKDMHSGLHASVQFPSRYHMTDLQLRFIGDARQTTEIVNGTNAVSC